MRRTLAVLMWCGLMLHQCLAVRLPDDIAIHSAADVLEERKDRMSGSQSATEPRRPVWPDIYTVTFVLSMPYLYFSQPQGLSFPVTVWYDKGNGMRMEILDGLDITLNTPQDEFTIYPRFNETRCGVFPHGPVRGKFTDTFLPDMSDWDYGGSIDLDGKQVNMWRTQHIEGTKVSQYTFYVTPDNVPVKLLMAGVQYFTGGHFDEYNYDFTSFSRKIVWPPKTDPPHPPTSVSQLRGGSPFDPPSICDLTNPQNKAQRLIHRHPLALQAHALTPRVRALSHEDAYHAFARAAHDPQGSTGSAHRNPEEYQRRLANFQRVLTMIHTHNQDPTQRYKMRLNRWADWDEQEWQDLMLPNAARREAEAAQGIVHPRKPLGVFQRTVGKKLPKEVDWRGTGADPGVKDQGMCGSCFAFAATATMEGTWYVSTGQRRSFSEQQLLDCSWDWPPSNGCGGGDYQPLIQYVTDTGGIALEQEYPYLSNSAFCRQGNVTRVGKFKGWMEVHQRDEEALMEAVATLGPIAVAVDAKWESFRYYAEGVYSDPKCRTASDKLDHAVVLFGYGTTDDGEDYWLVRNTWSKFYGDDGHIKIKRGAHDCGISSDPAAAIVADEAVVAGMASLKRLEAVKQW